MEAVLIDVASGDAHESQSGLQLMRPRIWGAFHRAPGKVAAVVIHPTSNFMHHYLLEPLCRRGVAALGLNTRYQGSDVSLVLERAIQDLGAGIRWLHQQGYERVLLIGNSGGAALVSLYQAQAEKIDITQTPAGDPIDLTSANLPPAQGIALSAAHLGRARLMRQWIDPSVLDEFDPVGTDPALDMFNCEHGPPYSQEFLARYRLAQAARQDRIEQWARGRLRQLKALNGDMADMAFVVHRTLADPRCLDPSIDPNDRPPGTSVWGAPKAQNFAANSMGRYTSLKAYLNQWAMSSNGDGPKCLARTSVPVLLAEHTADSSTFPSDAAEWRSAASGRIRGIKLVGGNHYLAGQQGLVEQLADECAVFARTL